MQDLARGWDIVWAHGHVDIAVWIAIFVAVMAGSWTAIASGSRKPEPEDNDMRPKRRAPLPRSGQSFR